MKSPMKFFGLRIFTAKGWAAWVADYSANATKANNEATRAVIAENALYVAKASNRALLDALSKTAPEEI